MSNLLDTSAVDALKPVHDQLHAMIKEMDVKLDSLQDPTTAGKKRVIDDRVAAQQERANKVVTNIVNQLQESSIDEKIGIYYGLIRGFDAAYKEIVSKAVEELVAQLPKQEALITEDEAKEIMAARSDLAGKVKQIIGMAQVFGITEGYYEPPKRTGKQGKRGPRALSFYEWSVGDKKYEDLSKVVEDYAQYYSKVAELTAAMRGDHTKTKADGTEYVVRGKVIDLTNPPETFSFTLQNGDVLVAVRSQDNDNDDDPNPDAVDEADSAE